MLLVMLCTDPTEVETVLRNHPKVSAAAVYGVPHTLLGELVEAAVTLNPRHGDDDATNSDEIIRQLRELCQKDLAAYKVPRNIQIVADFPRGPTGKIQKHILRKKGKERRIR